MRRVRRKYTTSEKKIIKNIKNNREHICYYCDRDIVNRDYLTIDHKEPYNGKNTTYENCVIACSQCNGEKKGMGEINYYYYLEYKKDMSKYSKEELEQELERIVELFRSGVKRETNRYGHKATALRKLIANVPRGTLI